jgi:glycosyltransferase involved in cell wall biosynthesis
LDGEERAYFEQEVALHCDGKQIEYVGPVTDVQKNALLSQAAALLFPIEWEEPFGIVMIEALACGTPVLAFARGAVPEVIEHGANGFLCHSLEAMAEAVSCIPSLDRRYCRESYEERFSDRVIVEQYERLYRSCARGGSS